MPRHAVIAGIEAKYGKTAAQVDLRWLLQKGATVLTKTKKPYRVAENFDILDFALTVAEITVLERLAREDGRLVSPESLAPDGAA